MILLIDNYDSFSYNLYQLVGSMDPKIKVVRNDAITIDEIRRMDPSHIILSPGPGRPEDAGICIQVARELAGEFPILGVCLGHQAICQAFGATITYATELMHGKQSEIALEKVPIFAGCGDRMEVARYHSLAVDPETLPEELAVIAQIDPAEGKGGRPEVMAVRHRDHPVYGLQFHPESIMTPKGPSIMKNFLEEGK